MKLMINGAGGRMGNALRDVIAKTENHTVVAAVDPYVTQGDILQKLTDFTGDADCILDFSNHACTAELVKYACERKMPLVVATTGHTEEELEMIRTAARQIPVFHSGNMSLGVALLAQLVRQTVALFPDADVEIVESHHNQKLDVPSGTALMLARAAQEARPDATLLVGRHENGKRTKEEIGIHSLRMGSTVGIHEVIVHTGTQIITLKHEAKERTLFAEGALASAEFLTECTPGLYTMHNIIK